MENRKSKKSLLDLRKKFWILKPLPHSFVNFESNRNISEVNKESINILFEPLEILTWVPHQMSDKLERRDNLENKRDIFFQDENFAFISRWFFLNWPMSTWLSALDRSLATCFQVFKFSHQKLPLQEWISSNLSSTLRLLALYWKRYSSSSLPKSSFRLWFSGVKEVRLLTKLARKSSLPRLKSLPSKHPCNLLQLWCLQRHCRMKHLL